MLATTTFQIIKQSAFQTYVDFAQIIAAIAAAVSVIYLALQIKMFKKEEKIKRSYEYQKRYNDYKFNEIMSAVLIFLRDNSKQPLDEKFKLVFGDQRDVALQLKLILAINFFEELGNFYNRNLVDKDLIKGFFKTTAISFFKAAQPYIEKKRLENRPTLCEHWERMVHDLEADRYK